MSNLIPSPSAAPASSVPSFLSGVLDRADSFLSSSGSAIAGIIGAINAPKVAKANATAAAQAAAMQRDEAGRLPGEPGYGTRTTPAGITAGGMMSGLPAWVKPVAIGAAILGGIALLWKLVRR